MLQNSQVKPLNEHFSSQYELYNLNKRKAMRRNIVKKALAVWVCILIGVGIGLMMSQAAQ